MSRWILFSLVICTIFSLNLARKHHKGKEWPIISVPDTYTSEEEKNETAWTEEAVEEGPCFENLPQDQGVDYLWFENNLMKGFRVPLASKMYYNRYAKKLSSKPIDSQASLNKICLKVTNNPADVFSAYTGMPLPNNWRYYAKDEKTGGIFFKLASQMTHFYTRHFFLTHKGLNESHLVEFCKSSHHESWVKNCRISESIEDNENEEDLVAHEENKFTIVKTDNKNYAVVLNCFVKENKKAWHVLSVNKEISPSQKKYIIKYIRGRGFKARKSVEVTYNKEDCENSKD